MKADMTLRFIAIIFFFNTITVLPENHDPDSMLVMNENADDTTKIKTWLDAAKHYINTDPERALSYARKALNLSKEIRDDRQEASSYRMIGAAYLYLGKAMDGLENSLESYRLYKEMGDKEGIAFSANNVGAMYQNLGNTEKALEYYLVSLGINEELGKKEVLVSGYNNLGIVNQDVGNYDNALLYYGKSLKAARSLNDREAIARAYNNIGSVRELENDYDKALDYYEKSLKIKKEINDKKGLSKVIYNIGHIYEIKDDLNKALSYYYKANALMLNIGDKAGLATVNSSIGSIYIKQNKIDQAISNLEEAGNMARSESLKKIQAEVFKKLSEAYLRKKDFQQSLVYFKDYEALKDSLMDEETKQKIARLQTQYELHIKEKELESLKKIHQLEIKKNDLELERYKYYAVITGVFLVILIIIIYSRNRLKTRNMKLLEQKNAEIEEKNKIMGKLNGEIRATLGELKKTNQELINSEKKLIEVNAMKDRFFSIIAHDLKNPIAVLLSSVSFLYDKFSDINENSKIEIIENLHNSSKHIASLLENLLQWSSSQTGITEYQPQKTEVGYMIGNAVAVTSGAAERKNIEVISECRGILYINADVNMISTVLRNLLSNAIKFTGKGGRIEIVTSENNGKIRITIEDNGIGISEENLSRLFRPDAKFTTKGTDNEKGTGLGLILCKEYVEKNKGTISVESEEGKGSIFTVELPSA